MEGSENEGRMIEREREKWGHKNARRMNDSVVRHGRMHIEEEDAAEIE
jgi:hypothetical protein